MLFSAAAQSVRGGRFVAPLLIGGAAVAGAGLAYVKSDQLKGFITPSLYAAEQAYQPSVSNGDQQMLVIQMHHTFIYCNLNLFLQVVSGTKEHALYLWIHLKPNANAKKCARVAANLQAYVDAVCPPDMRDESDEVWAGAGFGPNFYSQVSVVQWETK